MRWHGFDPIDLWYASPEAHQQLTALLRLECLQAAIRDQQIHRARAQQRPQQAVAVHRDQPAIVAERWAANGWDPRELQRLQQATETHIIECLPEGSTAA